MNDYLNEAYLATTYVVKEIREQFELKVGTVNEAFNRWCSEQDIKTWAIVTAYNPYSQECTDRENIMLNRNFRKELLLGNHKINKAVGIPADSNWKAEESFFIHNLTLDEAKCMGTAKKQNALVYGDLTTEPRLIWLV